MKSHFTARPVLLLIVLFAITPGCSKKNEPAPPQQEKNIMDVVAAAKAASKAEDYREAVAQWSEVLVGLEQLGASTEDVANTHTMRALAHVGNEDYKKALADYNVAIKLTPDYAQAYMGRAQVHFNLGDEAAMHADIQRAQERGMDMSEYIASVEAAGQREAAAASDSEVAVPGADRATTAAQTVPSRPAPKRGLEERFLAHASAKAMFADKGAPFEPAGKTEVVAEASAPGDGWYVDVAVPSRSTSDGDDDTTAVTVHMRLVLDEMGRMLDSRPMYITNADDTQLESLLDSL